MLIVFDFDQTLVDTSHLVQLRNQERWADVFQRMSEVEPYPGVDALLSDLADVGHVLAIVTHSPRRCVEIVVADRGWQVAQNLIIGYRDMARRKPDPSCLHIVMERSGLTPGEVVHIGDRPHDTQASRAAKVTSVGAAWGIDDASELIASRPEHVANSVEELRDLLMSW